VVSAGGTSVMRNAANDYYYAQYCWGGSGGGYSMIEDSSPHTWTGGNIGPWANFQYPIYGGVADGSVAYRTTPDFSFNADPASGVFVYSDYYCGGWCVVGGTSVSSPSLASIVNRAGNKLGACLINAINSTCWFTTAENNLAYGTLAAASAYGASFTDVTVGSNGSYYGPGTSNAVKGYDTCTGLGAAHTTANK